MTHQSKHCISKLLIVVLLRHLHVSANIKESLRFSFVYSQRYKMSLLKPSTKALALSCKVSVRTDSRGFLSLQYLVRNDDGQICFVEYYCCPDEEVEEE